MFGEGIVAIYKPKGMTSHDVIAFLRRKTGIQKIGHAGTLDPLARGVLVVGIGATATKELGNIVKHEKEYIAVVRLGAESITDDEEGTKTPWPTPNNLTSSQDVNSAIKQFIGKIQQVPPVYSALKIKGKEAYKRVRGGEKIEMQPREVEIKEIELLGYEWPEVKIRVVTGPGVYIRALARDLGHALGVGGYLADLERTRVGEYTKEKAISLT